MEKLINVASPDHLDRDALTLRQHFVDSLKHNAEVLDKVLTVLIKRKRKTAKKLQAALKADAEATRDTEEEFVRRLNRVKPKVEPWLMNQLEVLACERDMLQSATMLASLAGEHVLNEHTPPSEKVTAKLLRVRGLFRNAFADLAGLTVDANKRISNTPIQDIGAELDQLTSFVLEDLYSGERSTQNTSIMLNIVLEMRNLHRELHRAAGW